MSNLKDKMYEFEVTPPATAWDRIAAALDSEDDSIHAFPKRMHDYEVAAPAGVWDRISAELDGQVEVTQAPVVRGKFNTIFRYAAAAAVIAAIALIANQFFGNTGSPEATSPDNLAIKTTVPSTKSDDTNEVNIAPRITEDPGQQEVPETKAAIASNQNGTAKAKRSNSLAQHISAALNFSSLINPVPSPALYTYEDHVPNLSERYVVLMNTDGNFIRMAKKWGKLSCCVSGEEQDADCKDQLKKWQIKLANSPIAPAPGNFMDILGLVNSLSDDSQL